MQPRGTVDMGGEVGNVGYDQDSDRMLVAMQGRNDVAVIDPATLAVVQRVALPGCKNPHGLNVDGPDRLVFVACDENATLLTIDQTNWSVTGSNSVGDAPDVLAYDPAGHRLYVAAGAHVVAADPNNHRSYYPVPPAANGHPALLQREPS